MAGPVCSRAASAGGSSRRTRSGPSCSYSRPSPRTSGRPPAARSTWTSPTGAPSPAPVLLRRRGPPTLRTPVELRRPQRPTQPLGHRPAPGTNAPPTLLPLVDRQGTVRLHPRPPDGSSLPHGITANAGDPPYRPLRARWRRALPGPAADSLRRRPEPPGGGVQEERTPHPRDGTGSPTVQARSGEPPDEDLGPPE